MAQASNHGRRKDLFTVACKVPPGVYRISFPTREEAEAFAGKLKILPFDCEVEAWG